MTLKWLDPPVQLHSSRDYMCMLPTAAECEYQQGYWRFWYQADHRYALPTVYLFIAVIATFSLSYLASYLLPARLTRNIPLLRRLWATVRYFTYRGFTVPALKWSSPPLAILSLIVLGIIFFACMVLGPKPYYWPSSSFGDSPPLATRSGWLALGCLPFVFATSSKANMISAVTGISYEKLHVFHRWISYAFFILALLHTFPFIVHHEKMGDLAAQYSGSIFYWSGIIALVAQAWLTFASLTPIRKLSYEFFKISHFIAALVFMLFLFWHCDYTLTSWDYFIGTAAVYVPCWLYARIRTYFEHGVRKDATVFNVAPQFTRLAVSVNMATWAPGSHCFLTILNMGAHAWTDHPFSICSLPPTEHGQHTELVFYIRRHEGLTARLYDHASKNPGSKLRVLINGPYGGINTQRYSDSDKILVIAGGSGAGWTLPLIERFIGRIKQQRQPLSALAADAKEESNDTINSIDSINKLEKAIPASSRHTSLRVILATRDSATSLWYREAVNQLLSAYGTDLAKDQIHIDICLTGTSEDTTTPPAYTDKHTISPDVSSGAPTVAYGSEIISYNDLTGRPDLPNIIQAEAHAAAELGQTMGIFACGPSSMADDVRNAAAKECLEAAGGKKRTVGPYLHMEHFSWA